MVLYSYDIIGFMKSSDITILSSINPITISDNPSEKMVQFAKMWIASPPITEFHKRLSPLLKIPPQGFDITPYLGVNFDDIELFKNPFASMLAIGLPDSILKKFNLTESWLHLVLLTVYFNAVLDLEANPGFLEGFPITYAVGKKEIASKLFDLGDNEAIGLLLPFHVSKARVHKWIDDNWSYIDQAMDSNFTQDVPWLQVMKNWSLGQEIEELRSKKMTFGKISDYLSDKYPDDERVCDTDQIKKILKRYLESKTSFDSGFTNFLSLTRDM